MIRRRPPLLVPPRRRVAAEPVVAMINVVFLLLIFFLMTAQIVAPPPFDLTLPEASAADDPARGTLYVSADGDLAFLDLRGPEALLAAARSTADPSTAATSGAAPQEALTVQADARLDAGTLAGILGRLAQAGARDIRLATRGAR